MTESAPSTAVQPTLLANIMSPEGQFGLVEHLGVLTPGHYASVAEETDALLNGAVFYDLGWLTRVAVRGEDRFRWLSGMVTNAVNELETNTGSWNLVLNAQGRILGDVTVWREYERLQLELELRQQEKLLSHLDRFIIMDDVELTPQYGITAIGLAGPKVMQMLKPMGIFPPSGALRSRHIVVGGIDFLLEQELDGPAPRYRLWMPSPTLAVFLPDLFKAGLHPVGAEALEAVRVAEGRPLYDVDMAERDLPQETSQMHALHFNKGCYIGQEIVERVRSRGNVHRHLRLLELAGPLPAAGEELFAPDGKPAGQVTSAARLDLAEGERSFALAMVTGQAEIRKQPLNYQNGAGTATLLDAPLALGRQRIG